MTEEEKNEVRDVLSNHTTAAIEAMGPQDRSYGRIAYAAIHTPDFSASHVDIQARALDVAMLCLHLIREHGELYFGALVRGEDILDDLRQATTDLPEPN